LNCFNSSFHYCPHRPLRRHHGLLVSFNTSEGLLLRISFRSDFLSELFPFRLFHLTCFVQVLCFESHSRTATHRAAATRGSATCAAALCSAARHSAAGRFAHRRLAAASRSRTAPRHAVVTRSSARRRRRGSAPRRCAVIPDRALSRRRAGAPGRASFRRTTPSLAVAPPLPAAPPTSPGATAASVLSPRRGMITHARPGLYISFPLRRRAFRTPLRTVSLHSYSRQRLRALSACHPAPRRHARALD